MKQVKVSETASLFFEYTFKGNGKYHTTQNSGHGTKRSMFGSFMNRYPAGIEVVERGNDAPRGGKTGDFVVVNFTEEFFSKWGAYIEYRAFVKDQAKKAAAQRQVEIEALGDQKELLRAAFATDPEFLAKIQNRISNFSSKDWRNWVRLKACNKITNGRFELLTLSAPEIRGIAFESK